MLGKHIKSPSLHLLGYYHSQGQIKEGVCVFVGIVTQLVCVKLLLSLIRQEVVPSDGLKTQEVDISMPGIPALCSFCSNKKGLCITQAQHCHDINVLFC